MPKYKINKFFENKFGLKISALFVISFLLITAIASQPTSTFPKGTFSIEVEKGRGINHATEVLLKNGMIRNDFIFKSAAIILSLGKGVHAGYYRFDHSQNSIVIAYRMVKGITNEQKISVTVPEGTNVNDMAFIFLKTFPKFNAARFVSLAKSNEGYLYPDTYLFFENVKSEEIIKVMRDNFNKKINPYLNEIKTSEKSLADIVTMASIIEKEGVGSDRPIISGILWKRIREGIHMQVDPPFYFITGKTDSIKFDDIKIDSPYNTYKYKGLPKGPITNPSIDAIIAALRPVESKYYFYLTGTDKIMRYAVTYDGHLANKAKYMK